MFCLVALRERWRKKKKKRGGNCDDFLLPSVKEEEYNRTSTVQHTAIVRVPYNLILYPAVASHQMKERGRREREGILTKS